ncbi:MAG: pyridoxamine 5'-phosphate oxidase family protein [Devosia sp.]|nr:pyridoxamine 5'-phosphate oxidase family protein [Devosia sp.]
MAEDKKSVLQPMTAEVIAEVKAMVAIADHAALAAIEPGTGHPAASRVGLATLEDGTPVILISGLAAHRAALEADPRCSLLVGAVGKGDPLAHPRVTLVCRAEPIATGGPEAAAAHARYLARHPKAAIYVDLPDFRFFRLAVERASFNGGFGRAYAIEGKALAG